MGKQHEERLRGSGKSDYRLSAIGNGWARVLQLCKLESCAKISSWLLQIAPLPLLVSRIANCISNSSNELFDYFVM